jgi:hypothetical protein
LLKAARQATVEEASLVPTIRIGWSVTGFQSSLATRGARRDARAITSATQRRQGALETRPKGRLFASPRGVTGA